MLRLACIGVGLLTRWLVLCARAKVGGGQRRSQAHPWTLAAATALAEGGAAALALLGLRQGRAADALARAARSRPRAGVRGGQQRLPVAVAGEGHWRSLCLVHIGVELLTRQLALRAHGPEQRWGGGGAAVLALLGSLCWQPRAKLGGGGGSSTHVAQLAPIRVGMVLGVVCWSGGRGMGGNVWGVGNGPPALGHWCAIGGGTGQST